LNLKPDRPRPLQADARLLEEQNQSMRLATEAASQAEASEPQAEAEDEVAALRLQALEAAATGTAMDALALQALQAKVQEIVHLPGIAQMATAARGDWVTEAAAGTGGARVGRLRAAPGMRYDAAAGQEVAGEKDATLGPGVGPIYCSPF
jgi:hypothetical protein